MAYFRPGVNGALLPEQCAIMPLQSTEKKVGLLQMNNEEKILQMLGELAEGQRELAEGQRELAEDQRELNQRVARIEVEHGKKIDLILENQMDNNRNIEDLQQRMVRVEDKLDGAGVVKAVN